ncbi:UDP-glucose 4-epimerase GalE [Pseudomonas putida]|uniref:UDP-glucose 4-epimerase n=1 Tax=Pseudomonas putida TaxID=303 RepID=A0A1X1A330_PSEPU|nr:UDP-glucose 4-epimerase GalE [Pseudomonas putida]ORL66217.1 UDP-glucose 4-epimerase GalE [Pseudomonas putida]
MILLTGGTGFIGSHVAVELLLNGYKVVLLDNFSNSSPSVVECITNISGTAPVLVCGDIKDRKLLDRIFSKHSIQGVMHFAGLKAVGDSCNNPLLYYGENFSGTCNLLEVMRDAGVFNFVFSSSATVYKSSNTMPLTEGSDVGGQSNPYGRTKAFVEEALFDLGASDPRWSIAILRYFNPIGAHHSGLLGESPNGVPNNLVPYISQVLTGRLEKLKVFGNDFETLDGTGVRDYIHIEDLAAGHVKAFEYIQFSKGVNLWNLGTGRGYSVLEVIEAFERITGKPVPYEFAPRRAGDVAKCWADPSRAFADLNWSASRQLDEMVRDAWRWAQLNVK